MFPRKKNTFDVEETKCALGEFVKEYVITSRDGYDPDSFMDAAKETVINLLENDRQTKVKMILKCIMERTEIKTGEVIVKDAAFHSEQEVCLEGTDTGEMYMKMKDRVIENLTVFQKVKADEDLDRLLAWMFLRLNINLWKDLHTFHFLDVWLVKKQLLGGAVA